MTKTRPIRRCAIYTRKSTEEGLDQAFNSLHAQREACEAFIKSQAHEGWILDKTTYDDGGYSGCSMDRPALQQLMDAVKLGQIQVIVVYKVDRLTRSLADFAKIVEILDAASTSFVSVTQSFNTTTSMGRLTLNVLLSFAQFEREVTGERIRDKIAASKRKGLWMGGNPPLGYDVQDRKLVINVPEAAQVRYVFQRYLEIGSALALSQDLDSKGIRSKVWVSTTGRRRGGYRMRSGPLYHMLRNPAYIGQIAHKGNVYDGQHPAIIDQAIWDQVQVKLADNGMQTVGVIRTRSQAPLIGLLYDDRGNLMSPTHSTKAGGRRYPYYTSRALMEGRKADAGTIGRVPAKTIEMLVIEQLKARVPNTKELSRQIAEGGMTDVMRRHVVRITLREHSVEMTIREMVAGQLDPDTNETSFEVPIRVKARNGATTIVASPASDEAKSRSNPGLVRAIVRAHQWRRLIETGKARSVEDVGRINKCTKSYARFMLEMSFLAPEIVEAVIMAKQPRTLTVRGLFASGVPLSWNEQVIAFALTSALPGTGNLYLE